MADFTLSTRRIAGGKPSVPGLRVNGMSGAAVSINVPKLPLGIANIHPQQAPIPDIVDPGILEGAANFADVATKAVADFNERESDYQSAKVKLAFEEDVRKLYAGYQDKDGNFIAGYKSLQGDAALQGYSAFKEQVETLFDGHLSKVEPRVQQKAIIGATSIKAKYLEDATRHRVKTV